MNNSLKKMKKKKKKKLKITFFKKMSSLTKFNALSRCDWTVFYKYGKTMFF